MNQCYQSTYLYIFLTFLEFVNNDFRTTSISNELKAEKTTTNERPSRPDIRQIIWMSLKMQTSFLETAAATKQI